MSGAQQFSIDGSQIPLSATVEDLINVRVSSTIFSSFNISLGMLAPPRPAPALKIKHNSHLILQGLLSAPLQVPGDLLQPRHLERGGGGGGAQEGGEGTGVQYPGLPSNDMTT